jgi:hypothetical protein
MQSVAHNGFGCPYCRTKMAEEPEEEVTVYSDEEEEEVFDEDALRGFRFFWNNINGEEIDREDISDEEEMEEEWEDEQEENVPSVPTTNFVANKLSQQGVTFEQLVKMICNLDHEEYNNDEESERFADELFGKMRIIISNYTPEQAETITPPPPRTVIPVTPIRIVTSVNEDVDFAAQPKITNVRSIPRFMIHV